VPVFLSAVRHEKKAFVNFFFFFFLFFIISHFAAGAR